MTYSRSMLIRVILLALPMAAVSGLVLLMNNLHASAGIAFAAYAVLAVATGAAIGCFLDRLPGQRQSHHR